MKIAIMQPYLFPYLGYFQLIKQVDCFVVYDDAQYKKGGWVNRNRILYKNEAYLFTFGVSKASYQLPINERYFSNKFNEDKSKFCRILIDAYSTAPFYHDVINLVGGILDTPEKNVARFNERSLKIICDYLDIKTPFLAASQLCGVNPESRAQKKVIEIVKAVGGKKYINPIGGLELYSKEIFKEHSLDLSFLRMKDINYKQVGESFLPSLSIIDVMMFNSKETVKHFLEEYELT